MHAYGVKLVEETFKSGSVALVALFNKGVQIGETRLRELRRHTVWDGVVGKFGAHFISSNFSGQSYTRGLGPTGKGGNGWLVQSSRLSLSLASCYASHLGSTRQWVHLDSVANAVAHVKRNGTDIFHTQVTRAANKGATSKGWEFSFEDEIPHPPLVATAPPSSVLAAVSSFFRPTSSLPKCACCGDKLLWGYPHLHEL